MLKRIHLLSSLHRDLLESGSVESAGCFDCKATFKPSEIVEYIPEFDMSGDTRLPNGESTALCPACGTDSVIPVRFSERVLAIMNDHYFGVTGGKENG